ncbi:MAG: hypothetical protein H6737_12990 [Alphaproteobacteria bacterium]|nr:hypothetical protein [Alphaproteobacteria bacterium]
MSIRVRRLDLPAESRLLFSLPRRLHGSDPAWVAPLEVYERSRLKPSNPFFEHAELAVFGAFRGTELVGTASALRDANFDRDEGVVWFGFFESEDDPAIAEALMGRVRDQAKRWGGRSLRGPRNLTRWEYAGLTVEGFDTLPPMLQGHHPPHYAELLEGLGLERHHDTLAYEIDLYEADGRAKPIPDALRAKAEGCDIPGLQVRRARWRSMNADLIRAHEVLNEAYQTVPDVSPMPRATFLALGRAYLVFANTELMQLGLIDGRPAAFTACLPEVNEALVHARGRLLPLGLPRFVRGLRGVRTAAFKLIGVNPAYRGSGLHAKMIVNVVEGARRAGYSRIDGSVIDERNKPMRGVVEGVGMTVYRRYRHYGGAL